MSGEHEEALYDWLQEHLELFGWELGLESGAILLTWYPCNRQNYPLTGLYLGVV